MKLKAIKIIERTNSFEFVCVNKLLSKLPALLLVFLLAFGSPVLVYSQALDVDIAGESFTTDFVEIVDAQEQQDEMIPDTEPKDVQDSKQDSDKSIENNTESDQQLEDTEEDKSLETDSNVSGHKIDGVSPPDPVKRGDLNIDTTNGNANYSYKIDVPVGRNGLNPNLALNYTSGVNGNQHPFGYGWSINIPYIERLNKKGVDLLYKEEFFSSSLSGEIIPSVDGFYYPKQQDENFLTYKKVGDYWVLYFKDGQIYYFGQNDKSRQESADGKMISRWMLSKIKDGRGNTIEYFYHKDQGQIYPAKIEYVNYANKNLYSIKFERVSRDDVFDSYLTGFLVRTSFLINEIGIYKNETDLIKKYKINYIQGNNKKRSLLDSISEEAYISGVLVNSLNPTKFTYSNNTADIFSSDKIISVKNMMPSGYMKKGIISGDINSDGFEDLMMSYNTNTLGGNIFYQKTYIFNPKDFKFEESSSYSVPKDFVAYTEYTFNRADRGARIIDLDGDIKSDLLMLPYHGTGEFEKVRYNNVSGSWEGLPNNASRHVYYPDYVSNPWHAIISQDFNADGLVDFLQDSDLSYYFKNGQTLERYTTKLSLNKGGYFEKKKTENHNGFGTESYSYTPVFMGNNERFMMDVNGDNLPDIVYAFYLVAQCSICQPTYSHEVHINNGSGWQLDTTYKLPPYFAYFYKTYNGNFISKMSIADFNNDGLQDIIVPNDSIYINQGKSFERVSLNNGMASYLGELINREVFPYMVFDFNVDGSPDIFPVSAPADSVNTVFYINSNKIPNDLLIGVKDYTGSSVEIDYKTSHNYKDASGNLLNPNLPIIVNTVSSIKTNDGIGNASIINYEYAGGYYYYKDAFDRKFAGFEKVTKINPDGTRQISYNSQGNNTNTALGEFEDHFAKIGKTYRTDLFDQNNNLIKQETTRWKYNKIDQTDQAYFVYPDQTITRIFSGIESYDTAVSNTYNTSNGNLEKTVEYGTVSSISHHNFSDTGNDKRITDYSYATCLTCANFYLPNVVTKKDYNNNIVSKKVIYYDNQPLGELVLGNNTKEVVFIDNSKYAETLKSYNSYGLVEKVVDPEGNISLVGYDQYYLFPTKTMNALNQETLYEYNYNVGNPGRIVDPNGTIKEFDYDGFGRPLEQRISSDDQYLNLIKTNSYVYNDSVSTGGVVPYVKKINYYSNVLSGEEINLFDGLGRLVRELKQNGPSGYSAIDTTYDNMGRVVQKSLPYEYFGSAINYFGPNQNKDLVNTYAYDSIGRKLSTTNTLGSTTNSYYLDKVTIKDFDNKIKDVHSDAFGNITKVTEYNNNLPYHTQYFWNANSNLIKIIDSKLNIREFEYDFVGNRLVATDLHEAQDVHYGVYEYTYDNNQNLLSKKDPNQNVVNFTYDGLNRVTQERLNGVAQINYTYDSCMNGKGKLCVVSRQGSSTKNIMYTNRGLPYIETTNLQSKSWQQKYKYDFQGNITEIKYPDNLFVLYSRNQKGLISQIQKSNNGLVWNGIIDSVSYNSLDQKTSVLYANGRRQDFIYNDKKQYQLSKIVLDAPTGYKNPYMINTEYTFSAEGNLLSKSENADPANNQNFVYTYDDLHRLVSAQKTTPLTTLGYIENYSYDELGNIINKSNVGDYIYGGNAMQNYANPHAATDINGVIYDYDKNGNLIKFGPPTNKVNLKYSYRNELVKYEKFGANSVVMDMVYDYSGERIKKTDSSGSTYTPTKYFDESSLTKNSNIYLDNQLVATIEKDKTNNYKTYYIHPDHLGSTKVVTEDSGGIIVQELEYYPFGQILSNAGVYDNVHKYTGHEYDSKTDLNFMNARYQYGIEGRFWSQDPVARDLPNSKIQKLLTNPQFLNTYSYGLNNPLKYVDPDGMFNIKTGTVEKGDTLSGITNILNKTNGTNYSVAQVANLNNIKNPDKISVGQVLIPNKSVPDITNDLSQKMWTNVGDMGIQNPFYFKSKVEKGGDWDLKSQPGIYCSSKSCGGQEHSSYVFLGEKVPYDAPGNIHFGYVGSNALYGSPEILNYFAGRAQNKDNNTNTGDTPSDRSYINYGIKLFNNGY